MKERKVRLATFILVSLLASAPLTACQKSHSTDRAPSNTLQNPNSQGQAVTESHQSSENHIQTDTEASSSNANNDQQSANAYLTQIQYYELLIKELEEKLLEEKTNGFIANSEYQAQIQALQNSIADLNAKLENLETSSPPHGSNPTLGNGNSVNTSPTISTDKVESSTQHDNIYNNEENHTSPEQLGVKNPYHRVEKNGRITITAYTGYESIIEIPSTLDGMPVTVIGEEAFKNCPAERIIIPNTVTYIDWFAFYGCTNLCEITIPSSVTSIAHGAFDLCPENIIIKCKKGSYAELYAKSWGLITIAE